MTDDIQINKNIFLKSMMAKSDQVTTYFYFGVSKDTDLTNPWLSVILIAVTFFPTVKKLAD